jgi:N-acetylglucosaminyldiphosphoundecaprenol N-acetyl-beta-D-mannosaminyltransferase
MRLLTDRHLAMQASRPKGFKIVAMTNSVPPDDLSREVYGVLGIPVDAVDMATVLGRIQAAVAAGVPFLISTANLNFLVTSRSDKEFRQSLLFSDLCTADGMPIVWIARLLGVPVKGRIAGSDIFEAIKSAKNKVRLKVFLFGGAEGAAAAACSKLNAEAGGMTCAGSYCPGFETP